MYDSTPFDFASFWAHGFGLEIYLILFYSSYIHALFKTPLTITDRVKFAVYKAEVVFFNGLFVNENKRSPSMSMT